MKHSYTTATLVAAGLLALGATATTARAQSAQLSLTSDSDLTRVLVGQTIRINVNLTGLGGSSLAGLNASVASPGLLFDAPATGLDAAMPGAIVPNPDGYFGSVDDTDPGTIFADGVYDAQEPAGNISAEGTFFSFTLKAAAPGTGVIDFALDDNLQPLVTGVGPDGTDFTPTTADLSGLAVTVVPEPGSAAVLIGGFGLAALRRRRAARA